MLFLLLLLLSVSTLYAYYTPEELATINYYDNHAHEWLTGRKEKGERLGWNDYVDTFCLRVPAGCILEIGSGVGNDATAFISRGYQYIGTDVSETLLKIARQHNPTASLLFKSPYDIDFPAHSFEGFWSAATLLHIPKNRISEVLQKIYTVIKPQGVGFISLKEGVGEGVDTATNRFYAYYSQQEFTDILNQNNFSIISCEKRFDSKLSISWLMFFVQKLP